MQNKRHNKGPVQKEPRLLLAFGDAVQKAAPIIVKVSGPAAPLAGTVLAISSGLYAFARNKMTGSLDFLLKHGHAFANQRDYFASGRTKYPKLVEAWMEQNGIAALEPEAIPFVQRYLDVRHLFERADQKPMERFLGLLDPTSLAACQQLSFCFLKRNLLQNESPQFGIEIDEGRLQVSNVLERYWETPPVWDDLSSHFAHQDLVRVMMLATESSLATSVGRDMVGTLRSILITNASLKLFVRTFGALQPQT